MKHTKRAVSCSITALAMVVMLAGSTLSGNVTDTSQSSQQVNTDVVVVAESQDTTKETKEKETTQVTTTSEPKTTSVATADPEWENKLMANVEEALNVRTEASADADVVGKLFVGSVAEVVEIGTDWTLVKSGNVEGYVRNSYCVFGDEAKALAEKVCTTYATSKSGGLKVRYEATQEEGAKLLHVLEEGEKIAVDTTVEAPDGWVAVIYNGTTGYVSEAYVSVAMEYTKALTVAEEQAAEKAAAAAKAKTASSSSSKSTSSSSTSTASYSDLELLAALIYCEAGGESYEGQVAVGAVVMNRVESGSYPNTISGVIYQKGQFTPASSGKLAKALANGRYCTAAAQAALAGEDPTGGCLHFNSGYGQGLQIGNQHFW